MRPPILRLLNSCNHLFAVFCGIAGVETTFTAKTLNLFGVIPRAQTPLSVTDVNHVANAGLASLDCHLNFMDAVGTRWLNAMGLPDFVDYPRHHRRPIALDGFVSHLRLRHPFKDRGSDRFCFHDRLASFGRRRRALPHEGGEALGFYTASTITFFILVRLYDPAPNNLPRTWIRRLIITGGFLAVMYGLLAVLLNVFTAREISF